MRKMWLVASATYRERIRSGMFLILTFGVPLLMVVAGAVGFYVASREEGGDLYTVGYVDQTGALSAVPQVTLPAGRDEAQRVIPFQPFGTVEEAQAAFREGQIGGYLLIPAGYLNGEAVTFYGDSEPGGALEEGLRLFLRRGLLSDEPDWVFERLAEIANYTYVGQSTGEELTEGPALVIRLAAPAFLAVVFIFAVVFGTSQMGAAIIREKEQRAMEIVITSLRPLDLVAGKVLGLTLLSLTQFAIWAIAAVLALALAFSDQISLQGLLIPWRALIWGLLLIIPGYFLFAILAAGLGIIAGNSQQAQQLAGLVSLFALAPIYILGPILENPEGPLSVALTLFPFTSPSIALLRSVFAQVPTWQMAAALGILLLSLALSVWLVTRLFRAAMLNYGKALRPREIWQALSQA